MKAILIFSGKYIQENHTNLKSNILLEAKTMSTNASSSSVAASIEPTLTMQFCGAMVALQ